MIKEIKITVNDDGPGFPKDIIENLGEPYIKSKIIRIKFKLRFRSWNFLR